MGAAASARPAKAARRRVAPAYSPISSPRQPPEAWGEGPPVSPVRLAPPPPPAATTTTALMLGGTGDMRGWLWVNRHPGMTPPALDEVLKASPAAVEVEADTTVWRCWVVVSPGDATLTVAASDAPSAARLPLSLSAVTGVHLPAPGKDFDADEDAAATPWTFSVSFGRRLRLCLQAPSGRDLVAWLHALRRAFFAHAAPPPGLADASGVYAVFGAAFQDDGPGLRRLLRKHSTSALLAARDGAGNPPLLVAARHGAGKVLHTLLRWGADVADVNLNGETALCAAAARGAVACVDMLVRSVMAACRTRGEDAAGAVDVTVNHSCVGGVTPLMFAAAMGRPEAMEALLLLGADVMAADDAGRTVVHYAAAAQGTLMGGGHVEAALLVGSEASGGAGDGLPSPALACLALAVEHCTDALDWFDGAGNTPLAVAAGDGWEAGVRMLVEGGASPHAWNVDGHTPVVHAAVGRHEAATGVLVAYEDAVGLVAGEEDGIVPHPARWVHRRRAALDAAGKEAPQDLARVMAVWNSFFERALGGGGSPAGGAAAGWGESAGWGEHDGGGTHWGEDWYGQYDGGWYAHGGEYDHGQEYGYGAEHGVEGYYGDGARFAEGHGGEYAGGGAEYGDGADEWWASHYDESSGAWYWYNSWTGETRWAEDDATWYE